jgi:pimeloyl-ACP methyl ester carboxylesterase
MGNVKNVVLVHGAWADGSSWSKVIPKLQAEGLQVTAVQLPLRSLAEDVLTTQRAVALQDGPTILIGHSYGGAVITGAGNDPKVTGLVYVAAFAPDTNDTLGSLLAQGQPPSSAVSEGKPDAQGFIRLTQKGMLEYFAQDLPEVEKRIMFATQGPIQAKIFDEKLLTVAWKTKPSWYVIATNDLAIPPNVQTMMSTRIKADTVSVASSHVPMLSKPEAVISHILRATSGQRTTAVARA